MTESPRFTPVPTASTRHDGWTPARQRLFIDALAAFGSVSLAARAVGMTPRSAWRLRRRAGANSFAAAWDRALREGERIQYERAVEIAIHGETTPIFYGGRQVGRRHRYSHRIMLAALRSSLARRGPSANRRDVP